MMQRPLRALVLMAIVSASLNLALIIASRIGAPALTLALGLIDHSRFFLVGWAAGCVATGERALLAVAIVAVLLATWPTDPVPIAIAIVAGGFLGIGIRRFVESHREPVPEQRSR